MKRPEIVNRLRDIIRKVAPDPEFARFYAQMFNYRLSGDYDDFITFDSEIIEEIIPQAKLFNDEIEKLLNTDSE